MTDDRAILYLKDISMWGIVQADEYKALKKGIKSLKAWKKVKKEIKDNMDSETADYVLNIIDKAMKGE